MSYGVKDYTGSATTIAIPATWNGYPVTTIGNSAFAVCIGLTSVTFANTEGWYTASSSTATSGTEINVSDPATNATNLVSTFRDSYWKRG